MRKISGGGTPYRQVADAIRDAIEDGEYPPKSRLPSRVDLSTHFGVSPMTVQSALRVLRDEGTIVSRQGDGVFVAENVRIFAPTYSPHGGDSAVCDACGVVVADQQVHTAWHRSLRI